MLPETDIKAAETIADKLRTNIESLNIPHEQSKVSEIVTISLGIAATIPRQDLPHNTIVETADKCLYEHGCLQYQFLYKWKNHVGFAS